MSSALNKRNYNMDIEIIKSKLSFLGIELTSEIIEFSQVMEVPKNTIILDTGQYVKVLPLVLKGVVKVFSKYEEKEILLYYLKEKETCVMSYMSCIKNSPSRILAKTEEDSILLALSSDKIQYLTDKYPKFNLLFQNQFDKRYSDLLLTINQLIFNKLDIRVYDFLKQKKSITSKATLKITHKQIASELGTAREVVSRIIKKLENEGKISNTPEGIFIN